MNTAICAGIGKPRVPKYSATPEDDGACPSHSGQAAIQIEPHQQQEGRLQIRNQTERLVMPLPNFRDHFTHDF